MSGHIGYQFKGKKTIISKKAVRMVVPYKHRYTHFLKKTSNISDLLQIFMAFSLRLNAKIENSLIFLHKKGKEELMYIVYIYMF